MLLASEVDHGAGVASRSDHLSNDVVELGNLPTARRLDAAPGPRKGVVRTTELDHCLGDPDELVRAGEVASQQLDDAIDVAVDHGEPLLHVLHGEARIGSGESVIDGASENGKAGIAERIRVSDRVRVEEVLIIEAEPDHPLRQRLRVGDPGIAEPLMCLQKSARHIADGARGVIGVHDHLDHTVERQLNELEQLTRRSTLRCGCNLVDDGASVVRPPH